MTTIISLGLVLGAFGLVVGCSDDDSDSAKSAVGTYKKYDPCELLTQKEAETALGIPLENTRHDKDATNATGQKICYYSEPSATDMKFVQLSINEQASMASGVTAQQLYRDMKGVVTDAKAVTGVGDEAYYGGSGAKLGAGITTLVTSRGAVINVMVGLGTGNSDEAAHIAMQKPLVLTAIARL